MLYAASEQAQRVYALVEGRYQDVGALPGHPATFRCEHGMSGVCVCVCAQVSLHSQTVSPRTQHWLHGPDPLERIW